MVARSFAARTETFGLDTSRPWALDALRLLFNTPRLYEPLARAWDARHPGTLRALRRLVDLGLVAYQGPLVIDTRTGEPAPHPGRPVPRFRTSAKGGRLVAAMREDERVLTDTFPMLTPGNVPGVMRLLNALDLQDSHAKYGLSARHAADLCGLAPSTTKWWIAHLKDQGFVRELPERLPDVRAVVPAHWRVTRALRRQVRDVIEAFDSVPDSLVVEFRLNRTRFLKEIDPARIGISGATDFDHDVECQRILAALVASPRAATEGVFLIEPRYSLPLDTTTWPWSFRHGARETLPYQPDASFMERDSAGSRKCVL